MHTRAGGHKKIYNIYVYLNPWESNHRDGPTGHKRIPAFAPAFNNHV